MAYIQEGNFYQGTDPFAAEAGPALTPLFQRAIGGFGGLGGIGGGANQSASLPGTAPMPTPSPQQGGGNAEPGGLGGFVSSPMFGNTLQALGHSLLTGTRQNPLGGFSQALDVYTQRSNQREETQQERAASKAALISAGFTEEQAEQYARNPAAAKLALEARDRQAAVRDRELELSRQDKFYGALDTVLGSGGSGSGRPFEVAQTAGEVELEAPSNRSVTRAPLPSRTPSAGRNSALATLTSPTSLGDMTAQSGGSNVIPDTQSGGRTMAPTDGATAFASATGNAQLETLRRKQMGLTRLYAAAATDSQRAVLKANLDLLGDEITRTEKAGNNDFTQRARAAEQFGLEPGSAGYQAFVLTGKMPREDQAPLTATDKKAILEADEMVSSNQATLTALNSILAPGEDGAPSLNDRASYGWGSETQALLARNDPTGFFDDSKGEATTELSNVVLGQALESLKATFGAAPTEGERKILLDLQASVDKTPREREIIIKRAAAAAERRLSFNKQKADALRGEDYYRSGGAPTAPSRQSPPAPAPKAGGGRTSNGLSWSVD